MSKQENKTIQNKMDELAEMVNWFEGDEFSIEAALERFKQAEALSKEIEDDLTKVKNDIRIIKQRFDVA